MPRSFRLFLWPILMAITLACALVARVPPSPSPLPSPPSQTRLPSPTPTALPTWQLLPQRIEEKYPEWNFSLSLTYPQIRGSDQPYADWFNNLVSRRMEEQRQSDLQTAADRGDTSDLPLSLTSQVDYAVLSAEGWYPPDFPWQAMGAAEGIGAQQALFDGGHAVLSLLFQNSFYWGGAHPGSWFWTLNFDFQTGQVLDLGDLFIPGAPYLERIAAYSADRLREQLDFDLWEEGVAPWEDNFAAWALTPAGLYILFQEYQVAPYAAGPQQVLIPYAELSDLLHPDGALARFANR